MRFWRRFRIRRETRREADCRDKYDDASWHFDEGFPPDLPQEAGATHIGMYLAWALTRGLCSPAFEVNKSAVLEKRVAPSMLCMELCDGKLLGSELNYEGNSFSRWYYGMGDVLYYKDLETEFNVSGMDVYRIGDDWDCFARIASRIDARLQEFRSLPAR